MVRIPGGRLLRQRNFRLSLISEVVNRFGDSVDLIAMSWLIYQVSGSASVSALNFAVNYIPTVFLQPFCGVFVEKRNQKRLIVFCNLGRAAIVAAIALMYLAGILSPWMVLAGTFGISVLEAFQQPAQTAFIPHFMEREDYSEGVSLTSSVKNVVQIIGSAAAGVIIAVLGVSMGILIDAACFASSGLLIAAIREKRSTKEEYGQESAAGIPGILDGFREGITFVRGSRLIMVLAVSGLFVNLLSVPFMSLQAAICEEIFHRGPEVLSVINMALSLGTVIGSLLFPAFRKHIRPSRIIAMVCGSVGAFYLSVNILGFLAGHPSLFWTLISVLPFFLGLLLGVINVFLSVYLLENTPENYLARVSGLTSALCMAGQPVAALLISSALLVMPLERLMILTGMLGMAMGAYFLLGRPVRVLDAPDEKGIYLACGENN